MIKLVELKKNGHYFTFYFCQKNKSAFISFTFLLSAI